jgi:hypothetical protein
VINRYVVFFFATAPRRGPLRVRALAADFHQPLDVQRDLLAQIALDATHFLDDPADLAHVVFGQVLHPDVRAHLR